MISLLSSNNRQHLLLFLLVLLLATIASTRAWVSPSRVVARRHIALSSSTTVNSNPPSLTSEEDEDEDDDDEYEYVEYDILTEPDFSASEWLIGTCMDKKQDSIDETWVRLAVDKNGKNVAIWGDNSEGTWNWDTANQFLSFSKESLLGKAIWAGVVEDYYFTQGTVRAWNFVSAAAVIGQWQAKRLGVDSQEAGVAPWFETDDDEDDTPDAPADETEEATL